MENLEWAAIVAVAAKLGIGTAETLRSGRAAPRSTLAHGRGVRSTNFGSPCRSASAKADDPIGGNFITLMRFKVPVSIADPASGFARLTSAASR